MTEEFNENSNSSSGAKKKLQGLFAVVLVIAVLLVLAFYFLLQQKSPGIKDYVIEGVPYYGIFNHKGDASYLNNEVDASIASILAYWNPDEANNFADLATALSVDWAVLENTGADRNTYTLDDIGYSLADLATFVENWGPYTAAIVDIPLTQLGNFINPGDKIPLYTNILLSPDPELDYASPAVLVGVRGSDETLIFHNYWLGTYVEISFDDFASQTQQDTEDIIYPFLAIQLNEAATIDSESDYQQIQTPVRTGLMNRLSDLMETYAYAAQGFRYQDHEFSIEQFELLVNDPRFESEFPPYLKVSALTLLAYEYIQTGDYESARPYAEAAVEMNADLDKQEGEWPGIDIITNAESHTGEIATTHEILGDIHMAEERSDDAIVQYEKALTIMPNDPELRAKLAAVKNSVYGGN